MRQLWKNCCDRHTLMIGMLTCMAINGILLLGQMENRGIISFFNQMAGEKVRVEEAYDYFKDHYEGEDKQDCLEEMKPYLDMAPEIYSHTSGADLAFTYQKETLVTGDALRIAQMEYEKVDRRIRTYATAEETPLFVPGNIGFYHYLTRVILLAVALESVVLAFIVSLRAFKLENSIRAEKTAYATRIGRRIQVRKLAVLMMLSEALFILLSVLTFLLFEIVYPSWNLLGTFISSGMVLDEGAVCVTWFPISLAGHLGIFCLITAVLVVFTVLYAFILSNLFTTSPQVLLAGIAGVIAVVLVENLIPRDSALLYISYMNPVHLLLEAGHWLTSGGTFLSPRYYEIFTMAGWSVLFGGCGYWSSRYWNRKDVC